MNEPKYKGVYILPNLFTTASLFAGLVGMIWAIEGKFVWCALAVLFSCLCDGLDGKVARMTNSNSDFGVQLDSLADLVAFGVSPALMIYLWQTNIYGRLGLVCSFLFLACGALRLARFNVLTLRGRGGSQKYFLGMPIPAAASLLATFVLFSTYLPQESVKLLFPAFSLGLMLILSMLMVSRVRYPSFKSLETIKAHPFSASVIVVLFFVLVALEPKLIGFVFFMGYMLFGLLHTFILLPLRNSPLLRGLTRHKPS